MPDDSSSTAAGSSPDETPDQRLSTAVLFVHGMGSQKRFEDSARLVEALDAYTQQAGKGRLRGIEPGFFSASAKPEDSVSHIRATWLPDVPEGTPGGARPREDYRFYEAYWAPIAADGVPRKQVLPWMFKQVLKPWGALRTPWRHRARVRRAALVGLNDRALAPERKKKLFELYDEFEGLEARRDHVKGNFDEFERFIESKAGDQANALKTAGEKWHRAYKGREWSNLLMLLTIALAIVTAVGYVVLASVHAVALGSGADISEFELAETWTFAREHWETLGLIFGVLIVLTPIARFLETYLGDVLMWTTYEETNAHYRKRKEILAVACKSLNQVLDDPRNERVVVVAHSLGTAVAIDAILQLARDARSLPGAFDARLRRITHVVTYGSPIDKIQYLFEETGSRHHRYNRIIEDLRGDIGTEPFAQNGKRYIHWVNFWDKADIIAGTLESQSNRKRPELQIDNVEVKGDRVPNPGGAHTGYLNRPRVLEGLYEIIFERQTGRCDGPFSPDRPFGPGEGRRYTRAVQLFAGAAVWLLAGLLVWAAFAEILAVVATVTLALAGVAFLFVVVGKVRGG